MHVFLIGGGRKSVTAHIPFARSVRGPVVGYVLDSGPDLDLACWAELLAAAGVPQTRFVVVSPQRPPLPGDLAGAGGIYVAGGLTPRYRDVLVDAGTGWWAAAMEADLPYAGFSAGAAIAPVDALVGGWRTTYRGQPLDVCDAELGEELDPVTVLPGLGLVDFLVDVHAAQWGTLHRLVHGVLRSGRAEGWAIDENTALEVDGDIVTVRGGGAATRVRRSGDEVVLSVHLDGDKIQR